MKSKSIKNVVENDGIDEFKLNENGINITSQHMLLSVSPFRSGFLK